MPKIIPELREKIVEVAEELYAKNSYTGTDMRHIAQLCGIAVGTLYNYFPNKQTLFVSIFERAWNKKIQRIKEISQSQVIAVTKLKRILNLLNHDIAVYKGIGEECFEREIFVRERDKMILLKRVFNEIFEKIRKILIELIEKISREQNVILSEVELKRLSCIMLYALPGMVMHFPEQEKENAECMVEVILSYIQNKKMEDGLL